MSKRGKYIVVEGADAVGKSTQINLLKEKFEQEDIEVVFTYEPGGTELGIALRQALFEPRYDTGALAQLHLFTANRIDIWEKIIEPNLSDGKIVVSDRSWYSSLAYQGYGGKLPPELVETVTITSLPEQYVTPNLALVLQLTAEERKHRNSKRNIATDTFELKDEEYFERVRHGYENIARDKKAVTISGSGNVEEIHEAIWRRIKLHL